MHSAQCVRLFLRFAYSPKEKEAADPQPPGGFLRALKCRAVGEAAATPNGPPSERKRLGLVNT